MIQLHQLQTASMEEKNCFDMTKLIFKLCVSLWCSGQGVACTCRLTGFDPQKRCFLFSVFCTLFFFLFGLFFKHYFSFWSFFLYSYCWPCWSYTWINIYFKLKSGVLFWKRDFKTSWSAYWPSLRPNKNHKPCQDMSLFWNSWIFFRVSWHHDKQHTVHHKLYLFTPNTNQWSWPTGES